MTIEPNDKHWSGDEFDGLYGPTGVPLVSHPMEGLRVDPLGEALARVKELEAIVERQHRVTGALVREIIELRDRIRDLENDPMRLPELPSGYVYEVAIVGLNNGFVQPLFPDERVKQALAAIAKIGGAG